jgi:EAL and modified HD-GYP domain-containing signal transduction protein
VQRPEVAVVRHPIADGRNNVVGFELRFGGAVDLGDPSRDAKATSALLVEAFGDIGLERLAGRHPAWVSIARNFQGDYFAKPRLFRHRGVATAGLGSLRQLSELTSGDVSFEDLERIISSDVGLSLKLLRYVNSAFFALPRTVSSVREALGLLGVRTVRRWATVMAISAIPDVPDELVALGLRRARMCEMLAGSALPEERETLFTIGLFSVADALLDAPMGEVLDSLPFTEEIQTALLRREGPKGELLSAVTAYERGEFPTLQSADAGVSLAGAYRAALEWADEAGRAIA